MSCSKKWSFKSIFTAYGVCGCGCGCGRAKSKEIFVPKPESKTSSDSGPNASSSSSWERSYEGRRSAVDVIDQMVEIDPPKFSKLMVSPCPKICDSLAIVKDSEDPYQDFRQSMLQMILERQIYSRNELQELLKCFLELNSHHHHEIIVRAFAEIWKDSVQSKAPVAASAPSGQEIWKDSVQSKAPVAASAPSGQEAMKSPLVCTSQESGD